MKGILGKKLGMTQIFDEKGVTVPVTVIEAGPCVVVQKKTSEKDGYNALQLGFGKIKEKSVNKPLKGHFAKNQSKAVRHLGEVRVDSTEEFKVGQEIKVDIFKAGELVDVIGRTIGKGFAGGMKRWNFSGGGASHGSMIHRQPASGGSTDAAKVIKGKKGPGRLGNERNTAQGLKVVRVDSVKNLLLIKGTVPGANNSLLFIKESVIAKRKR